MDEINFMKKINSLVLLNCKNVSLSCFVILLVSLDYFTPTGKHCVVKWDKISKTTSQVMKDIVL